jgi:hypothetical protein
LSSVSAVILKPKNYTSMPHRWSAECPDRPTFAAGPRQSMKCHLPHVVKSSIIGRFSQDIGR